MRSLLAAVAAATLTLSLTACAVPDSDGTAADRADINQKAAPGKAGKSNAGKSNAGKSGPDETTSQENARESAASYLDLSAYSRSGLIKQLKFEGFSTKDATYGVDAQNADYKKQAAAAAQSYLDLSSYSRSSLLEQLKYEGYTQEQAEYGVKKVGL